MKEKIENKQKRPWYVRLSDYFDKKDRLIERIIIIIAILLYILDSAIALIYLVICLAFMILILLPADVLTKKWKRKHKIDFEE